MPPKRKASKSPSTLKEGVSNNPPQCNGSGQFQSESIRISSWNVNGFKSFIKKKNFNDFLTQHNPDILCLNETKISVDQRKECEKQIPYEYYPFQYWNCCTAQKGYSGTALFSKIEPISVAYGIGKQKHDGEGRSITAEFVGFYVIATYIPNAGQGLKRLDYRVNEWDKDFREYLLQLEQKKPIIWLGDLNVISEDIDIFNKMNPKLAGCSKEERNSWKETMKSFTDSFRKLHPEKKQYSWWNGRQASCRKENKGWRLDYIVVSNSLMSNINDSIILDQVEGSDHCPVMLILNQQANQANTANNQNKNQEEEKIEIVKKKSQNEQSQEECNKNQMESTEVQQQKENTKVQQNVGEEQPSKKKENKSEEEDISQEEQKQGQKKKAAPKQKKAKNKQPPKKAKAKKAESEEDEDDL